MIKIDNHDYFHIFGIRDLFPNSKNQLELINNSINTVFQNDVIVKNISLIIAIMEIETWFLANHTFFIKINPALTSEKINETLGINIESDDLESYKHPAKMIDEVLKIIGKAYRKKESDAYSICSHLDYEELCANKALRARIKSFDGFMQKLDNFTN